MRNLRVRRITVFFLIILLIPVLSHLLWQLEKSKHLNILIIDKTVPLLKRNEHRSFNWVLNYMKFSKTDRKLYSPNNDYKGFFPVRIPTRTDSGKFIISDLESMLNHQLDSIADKSDVLYFADNYGVYHNEWYRHKNIHEHSNRIYGGLTSIEINLTEKMMERNKLIIAEFNFFASPTGFGNRTAAQKLLGIRWKGWTFRYFDLLDTIKNKELPRWIVKLYLAQHNNEWSFKNSGIVMHHGIDDIIEILDSKQDLIDETPMIVTNEKYQNIYNLPALINYPYWLDFTDTIGTSNEIIAHFRINTTQRGSHILRKVGLPNQFPCIIKHKNSEEYSFYYFCGDFADNPIDLLPSYFKGITYFSKTFYSDKPNDRTKFFWKYYKPLIGKILSDYYMNHK